MHLLYIIRPILLLHQPLWITEQLTLLISFILFVYMCVLLRSESRDSCMLSKWLHHVYTTRLNFKFCIICLIIWKVANGSAVLISFLLKYKTPKWFVWLLKFEKYWLISWSQHILDWMWIGTYRCVLLSATDIFVTYCRPKF